ncbi:MAG TPA: thiamine pyrophosphate-binding protein [Gemmatimonadales bacterium]|jgi:acetolactate synthase-1/2/3 large subunit|nr:thiamine pyrophosphate-binding protein [Gemmatimonadales bacterium]
MKLTGGEIVVRALEAEGIRHAFGIPGTHNIELYDALRDSRVVRPVLVTDEQSAGFMADGLWRASGELGCVNLVPGAGLTHALSGIAEAYMDGVPMLVLGCGIRRSPGRAYQLHDVDQLAMARPVTKGTFSPTTGAELYSIIRDASTLARSGTPGPVMVEVSVDLYLTRHEVDPREWGTAGPSPGSPPAPNREELGRAALLLGAPDARPLIYAGLGAQGAQVELVALAEILEAPVATTIQGKGVFPESHPLFLWNGFGRSAPPFARDIAADRAVTLAIGCRFSEVGTGGYGLTPPGRLIHVDINPDVLGRNYPAELAIAADSREFLAGLLAELGETQGREDAEAADGRTGGRADGELRERIRLGHTGVRKAWLAARSAGRVTPFVLLDALQRGFGPETVFTADSGNGTFLAMECLRLERPGRFLAPVDYSCMGYAVPAAIGAKLGAPASPVVALAGDGALLMTGLELLTAASQGVPIAVFVLRDRELAQIAQFQATAFNRRTASVLPDFHAGGLAEAVGVEWLALERDEQVEDTIAAARAVVASGRPVLVDVAIDYSEKTWFTRGVVKTMLARLPWPDRLRFVLRALRRRLAGSGP